jgi:hypothetical protein
MTTPATEITMTVTKGDWTPEAMDDLKERLRSTESPFAAAEKMARIMGCDFVLNDFGKSVVRAAKGTGRLCNPDGPEALAYIETLEQHVSELEEALRRADEAMTCRRDDDAHYCPNCDNSLYEARDKIRAALNREPSP